MRVLIAEDDAVSRLVLVRHLEKWGYDVLATTNGEAALAALLEEDSPRLAILDWMMPGIDGVEVCRRIRTVESDNPHYIILLTARTSRGDLVEAFETGADDYVTKPFDAAELKARVNVGAKTIGLQAALADRVRELEEALRRVKMLHGLLPICMYCKSIRDDSDYWHRVEDYIASHADAQFSHGICPKCYEKVVNPMLEAHRRGRQDEEK